MADYIYLLQTRLTRSQQAALEAVRDVARANHLTVFLVGGAVRDLTSGAPVRDLDLAVQGDAVTLRKELEARGAITLGSYPVMQTLHLVFPGGVRLGVESTLTVTYPKPGKPVTAPGTILDDLRRRDFTVNAMAVSLNEGSYGLLMDPLNGVADLENRDLRLVSNYGFIEDPARMLRGVRFAARSGWQFEEKTQQRYETGKTEGYVSALGTSSRGYEIEDIFHEEEPLRVLRRLEEEGWMKTLFPALQSAKANEAELERLRDLVDQLQTTGIYPDPSAANFPLMTAKMAAKDVAELKKSFARPGFVDQIESLEANTKEFATRLTAKNMAAPSDTWKLLLSSPPEQVLWLAFSSKNAGIQARFKAFFEEWPAARQRIPYQIMQEMRITPDLAGYDDLLESLFFALMDGKLETPEAIREFLSPYSPPAPPPPVNMRRRPAKRESKSSKSKAKPSATTTEMPDSEATPVEQEAAGPQAGGDAAAKPTPPKRAPVKKTDVAAKASPAKAVTSSVKAAPVKGTSAAKPKQSGNAAARPTKASKLPVPAANPASKASGAGGSPAKTPAKAAVPTSAAKKLPLKAVAAKKPSAAAKGPAPVKTIPAKAAAKAKPPAKAPAKVTPKPSSKAASKTAAKKGRG